MNYVLIFFFNFWKSIFNTGASTSSNHKDFTDEELPRAKQEFLAHHYVRFMEHLVGMFSLDWYGRFDVHQRRACLDVFFTGGVPQDVFMVLSMAVLQSRYVWIQLLIRRQEITHWNQKRVIWVPHWHRKESLANLIHELENKRWDVLFCPPSIVS